MLLPAIAEMLFVSILKRNWQQRFPLFQTDSVWPNSFSEIFPICWNASACTQYPASFDWHL